MKRVVLVLMLVSMVVSTSALAQGLTGGMTPEQQAAMQASFRQGLEQAERTRARREQAEREAAAQAAEQERQRQAYDLQLRNQQEAQKLQSRNRQEAQSMQSQAHADESRRQEAQIRRSEWDRLVEGMRKKIDALWNMALSDANNQDYSSPTRTAARVAMIRLSDQLKGLYTFTPNFEDQESFRAGISRLPSPELGYEATYSPEYINRQTKKTHKTRTH